MPPSTSRYEHFATMVRALAAGTSFGHQGTLATKVRALATKVSFDYQGKLWPPWYELCIKLRAIKVRALPTKRGALGTVQLPPLCFESLVMFKRVFECTYSNSFSY